MLFEMPRTTLYYKGAKGEIREWSIYQDNQDIVIHHGVYQGARQEVRALAQQDIDI